MRRTMTDRPGETPTRFVVERASRRVLGVHIPGAHILGDDAPEMMQAVAVAPVVGVTKGGATAPAAFTSPRPRGR